MIYIANAFSLQMISNDFMPATIKVSQVSTDTIKNDVTEHMHVGAVGHPDTALVVNDVLGIDTIHERVNIALTPYDTLYVAQLVGGRLPVGATTLPEGFEINWYHLFLV